jgi:2'-5' RNA ligase
MSETLRAFIAVDLPENVRSSLGEAQEVLKSLAAKGIGVFPDIRRPRVIWAGLSGQLEILQDIQRTLDGHLAGLGFAKETRGFKAHLTLGRVKGKIACDRLQATIVKLKEFESKSFVVNRIILFKSELRPSGAVYTQVRGVNFD